MGRESARSLTWPTSPSFYAGKATPCRTSHGMLEKLCVAVEDARQLHFAVDNARQNKFVAVDGARQLLVAFDGAMQLLVVAVGDAASHEVFHDLWW